jgi:hypothetical protein
LKKHLTYITMRLQLLPLSLGICLLASCTKDENDDQQPPIANNQALVWTKTYGGTDYDMANNVVQLSSGEYVMAGETRSNNGDIPGSRVGYDSWLSKYGTDGLKQWSYAFGVNGNDEHGTAVTGTSDGNIIMVGFSFNTGQNFAWAIKTNAAGDKQWEKPLSTSADAKPLAVVSSGDGGAIVAGYENTGSSTDGFILKIDGSGNISWKKNYGGSSDDQFQSLTKNSDGSYTLAGSSKSSDGDLTANKGNFDGWILKVDASGNKLWSVTYGGSSEDQLTGITTATDGGYVVAGSSKSSSGDLPGNKGGYDAWIVKLDASGAKSWVKNYGGVNEEYITGITKTSSGSYVILGHTNSTTGDVTRTFNDFGGWLLKFDANGAKTGASTYGDKFDDFTTSIITTQDGGYMITGFTDMTSTGRGYDAWLVKVGAF